MIAALERLACTPIPVQDGSFNPQAILPYGCQIAHVAAAMREFVEFLGYINTQLHSKQIARLESLLMPPISAALSVSSSPTRFPATVTAW